MWKPSCFYCIALSSLLGCFCPIPLVEEHEDPGNVVNRPASFVRRDVLPSASLEEVGRFDDDVFFALCHRTSRK